VSVCELDASAKQTIRGEPERIMLWTQVITGLEVDELTAVRDAKTWQERRDRRKRSQFQGSPRVRHFQGFLQFAAKL
jgi:hypothetical protein